MASIFWRIFALLLVLSGSGEALSSVFDPSKMLAAPVDASNGAYKRDKLTCRDGAEIHKDQCVSVCQFGALGVFSSERECQSGQLDWLGGACVGTFALVIWVFIIIKLTNIKNVKNLL